MNGNIMKIPHIFFLATNHDIKRIVYIVNITSKSHLSIPRLILTFLQSLPSPHIPAMNLLTKRLTEGAHAFQQTYGPKDADQAQDT